MKFSLGVGFATLLLSVISAAAQQAQPYAGMETRGVKALSSQQIDDLKAGRGMGFALPAELNGYPGPIHVLELGEALHLSAEQRARTQALYEAMRREAIPLGERLIAQEAELDRAFAGRTITPEALAVATAAIGATQGALRAAHLRYHLAQAEILSPHQMGRYAELRGYAGGGAEQGGGHQRGGHGPRH